MPQKMTFPTMTPTGLSYTDLMQMRVDAYNAQPGTLTGYDCKTCRNKGMIAEIRDGYEVMCLCSCMKTRDTLRRIHESGLESLLRICTFQNYTAEQPFQQHILQCAKAYLQERHRWCYIGGQTGCGKTHICTAIVGGMIRNGFSVRYMVWREASTQLKAALTAGSSAAQIAAYKEADVLYIDDLFKTSSTAEVSGADVRLAFEILDYRARNQMLTILSTEWLLPQLRQIDGAIGGRIIQMSKGYAFEIRPDNQKDYRLRK